MLTLEISSDITLDYDMLDYFNNLSNINLISPYKNISGTVRTSNSTSSSASICAVSNTYLDIMNLTISAGRVMSQIDLENASKICLLGNSIAESLFEDDTAVGNTIKIDGDNYTVVGVLTAQGSTMGSNIDNMVLVPFTTAKYLGSDTTISNLYIKATSENVVDALGTELESFVTQLLDIEEDDLTISTQDSMLDTMENIDNSLSLMLGGIASISLIVGGIGVMNVMLVSVTERTKEIGIRKALGAKKIDILVQFLVEALVICVLGGIIGIIFGLGIGYVLSKMGYAFSPDIGITILAFSSSAVIGLIFGIFPAYKASKLSPIDALHTE